MKIMNLILEALPAVTVPPFSLKLGRSFLIFAASNWIKIKANHITSLNRIADVIN